MADCAKIFIWAGRKAYALLFAYATKAIGAGCADFHSLKNGDDAMRNQFFCFFNSFLCFYIL